MHMAQTAGLALATDLAPEETRPRVVALLYVMLLVGMISAALVPSGCCSPISAAMRLIQVVQGAAVVTVALNLIAALWKQEPRRPELTRFDRPSASVFPRPGRSWPQGSARCLRLLVAVALGTAAFSMQDILLEPYGGEILQSRRRRRPRLLTALLAGGSLIGFAMPGG
jgi:BCD family chlorophyll transporter-like MFS transporter